jgi:hypothetical protein
MIDYFVKDMFLDGVQEVMQCAEFVRYRLTLEQGSPSLESKLDSILARLDMLCLALCKVDPDGLKGLDRRSTVLLEAARTRVGVEISTPDDPVHLTHVGFNTSAEEFTGLTEELQQILQGCGISRTEQDKNPKAAMEIVKFYQEGVSGGDIWDKMGGALKTDPPILPAPPPSKPLSYERFCARVCLFARSLTRLLLKLKSDSDRHQVHQSDPNNRHWCHNGHRRRRRNPRSMPMPNLLLWILPQISRCVTNLSKLPTKHTIEPEQV